MLANCRVERCFRRYALDCRLDGDYATCKSGPVDPANGRSHLLLTTYNYKDILQMPWMVRLAEAFVEEFDALPAPVQTELLANTRVIERFGPAARRPRVDTLNGSRHSNMKELRFEANGGVWRVAFAFDSRREAILLAAGNKAGVPAARFYRLLIHRADRRFSDHLTRIRLQATRH